jgi:hypothetical protein
VGAFLIGWQGAPVSNGRKYIDLNLELRDLDAQTDTFKVAVLPSEAGETQQAVTVAFRHAEMADTLDDLERKRIDDADLIGLGEHLATRLLPQGPVRDLFVRAINIAGQDAGVRLRMVIREPRLAQLPWEFAYLQMHTGEKDRRHFLALNPQVSLVRHEALMMRHRPLTGATPERLRLVAAMADVEGYPRLNLARERQVIEEALRDWGVAGVTIAWEPFIEDATYDALMVALRKGCDLFHFAGHGVFEQNAIDPQTGAPIGAGSIVLEKDKETKEPHLLAAGELALLLQNARVRVAVFGACESGRRDGLSAWTGVAPAIVERGVPAVVAMQYEVLDDHAVAFSRMFYASLAAGLSVDEAVSAGRLAMLGASTENNVEWGVPVLYMRSPDGIIFPELAARKSETATAIRRVVQQTIDVIEQGGEVVGIVAKRAKGSFEVVQKAKSVKGKMVGVELDEL